MSWKGTKKTFGRLPQNLREKTGLGHGSHDVKYEDVLSRFNSLVSGTEKLYKDAIKFRDSFSHMLNHQANIADILVELYSPIVGKDGSETTTRRATAPVKTMKTVKKYKDILDELRDILLPELDCIDESVVNPSKDFIDIIKHIKKTISKRDHKRVDFDRFKSTVKKLQEKKDRTPNDEKALIKAEENLNKATEEYDYYNNLIKEELPMFFEYRVQFLEPLIANFYNIQLRIYGIWYEKMDQLVSDTGHFDVQSDIVENFDERKVDVNQQMEQHLTLLKKKKTFKKESHRHNSNNDGPSSSRYSSKKNNNSEDEEEEEDDDVPPPYSSPSVKTPSTISRSTANSKLYPVQKKVPPPLPPHSSKPKPAHYVKALYDYDATEEGDLSFRKGDKIEVIERTEDVNDWWKGKLSGVVGVFPGNYVEDY